VRHGRAAAVAGVRDPGPADPPRSEIAK